MIFAILLRYLILLPINQIHSTYLKYKYLNTQTTSISIKILKTYLNIFAIIYLYNYMQL